jgi:choline-sulfatase
MRNHKIYSITILLFLFLFCAACAEKRPEQLLQDKVEYLRLLDLGDLVKKHIDAATLGIDNDGNFLEGWSSAEHRDDLVWRWSNGKESTIKFYASDTRDRIVKMHVWPFNPAGEPYTEAEVYVNDELLTNAVFSGTGYYDYIIDIPSHYLHIGSNTITFKWKYQRTPKEFELNEDTRTLSIAVASMEFLRKGGNPTDEGAEFKSIYAGDRPALLVPRNGIVEMTIDLSDDPVLAFGLLLGPCKSGGGRVSVCITNDKGETITGEYTLTGEDTSPDTIYAIDLKKFSNDAVKIVFSNAPTTDASSCSVRWINPAIFSSADRPYSTGLNEKEFSGNPDTSVSEIVKVEKPHVFIYLIDALRADHLHCYGYDRQTSPNIDEFTKDAVLYENCFSNASWTRSSVASILTGVYPYKHLAKDTLDRLSNDIEILPEILKKAGYTTIYITTNAVVSEEFGFNQGNDYYSCFQGSPSSVVNSALLSLLNDHRDILETPVFAYLHTLDPHEPYTPEEPFQKFCSKDTTRDGLGFSKNILKKKEQNTLSPDDLNYIEALYDGEILQNDSSFGEFIGYLKKAELYDDSLIILIADHGEEFYEHGGFFHGTTIYNEEVHVPLIIKYPENTHAGMRVEGYVTQVDVLPTILEYVDIDIPAYADGISLSNPSQVDGVDRFIFLQQDNVNDFVGIIDTVNKNKVILKYPPDNTIKVVGYEKYDIEEDPDEKHNLAEKERPLEVDAADFRVKYFMRFENPPFLVQEKTDINEIDKETINNLKDLGYM